MADRCADGHERVPLIAGIYYACISPSVHEMTPPQLLDVWMISFEGCYSSSAGFHKIALAGDNSPTWQLAEKVLSEIFYGDKMQEVHGQTVRRLRQYEQSYD